MRLTLKYYSLEKIEIILVIINCILLGIWALKDTIALRNILLVSGTICSALYIFRLFRVQGFSFKLLQIKNIPVIMIGLLFAWVIIHQIFIGSFSEVQLMELKSTWFRCSLAFFLGFGSGILIRKKRWIIYIFWVGISTTFIILICQHISVAVGSKSLFLVPISYEKNNYIYFGKINGVLMGITLIAGLGASIMDDLRNFSINNSFKKYLKLKIIYWIINLIMFLYVTVYIFDSLFGIGFLMITFLILICLNLHLLFKNKNSKGGYGVSPSSWLIGFFVLLVFSTFFYQQIQAHRTGWRTLLEDISISTHIDTHPNWQDVKSFGYPKTKDGRTVANNVYERVAWFATGSRLIISYPLGVGILDRPFSKILNEKYPNLNSPSTHSAWVDLGLSFGIPILILLPGTLVVIFFREVHSQGANYGLITTLSLLLIIMYLMAELSRLHHLEILIYWTSILIGIQDSNLKAR